jgi:hypothetical protein
MNALSIDKQHGTMVFHCDMCGVRRVDRAEGNWHEARLRARLHRDA